MTPKPALTRRRLLQLTGGVAAVGLAGCTGSKAQDKSGGEETTTDTHEGDHTEAGSESGHNDEGGHTEQETASGHDDEGGHHDGVGTPSDTAAVAMVSQDGEYHFEPHVVRVTVGGTVTWTNESGSHSTAAYHPDNGQPQLVPEGTTGWDSGILSEEGATFEHTFETEGVYHYYCTPHESLGMLGSVIVGDPDPHDQVALEDPPADKPDAVRQKLTELNEMIRTALGDDH